MNVLGVIKRWSKEFDDPYTTKLLFTSLVRSRIKNIVLRFEVHRIKCTLTVLSPYKKNFFFLPYVV